MTADRELDVIDRAGRQLAQRIHDMRAALLVIARARGGSIPAAELASRALRHDDVAGGRRPLTDDLGPTELDERVACIRCRLRERAPGSLWCRACQPARNPSGKD